MVIHKTEGEYMNELTIRNALREESKDIFNFILELAEFEKLKDKVVANVKLLEKSIFDCKHADVLFMEINGEKIGFCLYFYTFSTFRGKPTLYLEDLYIRKEFRSKGYGLAVLKYLANLAIEKDCARFEWSCLNWNEKAIDFYLNFGALPQKQWTLFRLEGEKLVGYKK